MYFQLTGALTNRLIQELRRFWVYHPKYRDDLVDAIQGKFSFRERPQRGIIVKVSGGSHQTLAADNYKGVVYSHVYLAKMQDKAGLSVEWVREDARAIQDNGGYFPSPPGVYYLGVVEENGKLVFYVDPLLDVYNEMVEMPDTSTGTLAKIPVPRSLRLYEQPGGFVLEPDVNYTISGQTITLTQPLTGGRWLAADYRYEGDSVGPIPLVELAANNTAIPGAVLAFGRRAEAGDQLAVVVQDHRAPAALEFGGRWELSAECEVFARDVHDQREIADMSVTYLFGVARSRMSSEGIEIKSINLGGEMEEPYDDTGDEYFFGSSFSMEIETEWSIHVPLSIWVRQAIPLTKEEAREIAGLPDDELPGRYGDITALESLGLESVSDPFWSGRQGTFEVIR